MNSCEQSLNSDLLDTATGDKFASDSTLLTRVWIAVKACRLTAFLFVDRNGMLGSDPLRGSLLRQVLVRMLGTAKVFREITRHCIRQTSSSACCMKVVCQDEFCDQALVLSRTCGFDSVGDFDWLEGRPTSASVDFRGLGADEVVYSCDFIFYVVDVE